MSDYLKQTDLKEEKVSATLIGTSFLAAVDNDV